MRLKALFLAGLCGLGLSCSDLTYGGEGDLSYLGYSLASVDGDAIPDLLSSLPGPAVWEGSDGSKLSMWQGQVACNEDGTAEERYGFRLNLAGSDVWDLISVAIDLTCEETGSGSVRFQDLETGEVLSGSVHEGSDGCGYLVKKLPNVESLRAGYMASESQTEFPAELEFSNPLQGSFREVNCPGM